MLKRGQYVQPLHLHNDVRLILFTSGVYVERSFFGTATFTAGDFIIRPAFFAHDGKPNTESHYVSLPLSRQWIRKYLLDYGWSARRGEIPIEMLGDLERNPTAGDEILANTSTRTLDPPSISTPMEAIASSLSKTGAPRAGALAQDYCLTPWQLTRDFRQVFYVNPTEFRAQARVQRALKLLAESQLSLSAVANDSGFADQSHLCRDMKRWTGCTPAIVQRDIAI